MQRTIAALSTKLDKFIIPDDDSDGSPEEEECTSNCSNQDLTHQSKTKNNISREFNISAFTIRLNYVGQVEGVNRSWMDERMGVWMDG
jgi:hypothetical protein